MVIEGRWTQARANVGPSVYRDRRTKDAFSGSDFTRASVYSGCEHLVGISVRFGRFTLSFDYIERSIYDGIIVIRDANQSSRTRLLDAAQELLREVGMAGTGIKDVVARSGAPIGSVYFHFPGGKTQLVTESLRVHAEKSRQLFGRFFDGKRPAATALRMLFNTAAEGFERAGGNKGCAIGTVTLDLTEGDSGIRELCGATFDSWIDLLAPHLPGQASDRADLLLSWWWQRSRARSF